MSMCERERAVFDVKGLCFRVMFEVYLVIWCVPFKLFAHGSFVNVPFVNVPFVVLDVLCSALKF